MTSPSRSTFIEPVSEVIEKLSAAGAYATKKRLPRTELKIGKLGIEVISTRDFFDPFNQEDYVRTVNRTIGWPEIDQSKCEVLHLEIDRQRQELRG